MVRAFYAMKDTHTPALIGIVAMSLNVVLSVLFIALFTRLEWMPHGGLALANSLATTLEMIGLLYFMRGRLQGLDGRRLLVGFGKAVIATFIMSLVLFAWLNQALNQPVWIILIGGAAIGAGVYGIMVLALGVEEAKGLLSSAGNYVRSKF